MRVSTKSWTSYFYPDATIFCDDPAEADNNEFTFNNPSVVFEVLSKSTEDVFVTDAISFSCKLSEIYADMKF